MVVCKHDDFQKIYRILLKFGTPLEDPKRNDQFFFTNGSSFIDKKVFVKFKNSIFPPKYTRYGKNVKKQNS